MKNNATPHEMNPYEMAEIFDLMDSPNEIVLQKNGRYAEIIHYRTKAGNRVVVAIDIGNNKGSNDINQVYLNGYAGGTYNAVVTLYAPDSMARYYEKYVKDIVYEKNGDSRRSSRSKFLSLSNESPLYDESIAQTSEESNNNIDQSAYQTTKALSDRDILEMAAGQIEVDGLTEQQKQALQNFKDRLDKLGELREQIAEQKQIRELEKAKARNKAEATSHGFMQWWNMKPAVPMRKQNFLFSLLTADRLVVIMASHRL